MTPAVSWVVLVAAWVLLLLVIFLAVWVLDLLERRAFDRHTAQALDVARGRHPSRPLGPEDRADWGRP